MEPPAGSARGAPSGGQLQFPQQLLAPQTEGALAEAPQQHPRLPKRLAATGTLLLTALVAIYTVAVTRDCTSQELPYRVGGTQSNAFRAPRWTSVAEVNSRWDPSSARSTPRRVGFAGSIELPASSLPLLSSGARGQQRRELEELEQNTNETAEVHVEQASTPTVDGSTETFTFEQIGSHILTINTPQVPDLHKVSHPACESR